MSKVVLLAINAKYVHSSLSVWLIAEGVRKFAHFPHDVNVVEATINQPSDEIAKCVVENEPDVIGISSYIWNAEMLPGLLKQLREALPEAIIVLGGPEASNNINYWLDNCADFVLPGEGEFVFPRLLDSIKSSQKYPLINEDLSSPIDPYSSDYFDALNGRLAYIETSRGCPFQCAFCLSADTNVKYFPLDKVKEQILMLSKSNTKTLKFVDRTFNCNAERACEIFQYVVGLDTNCCFHFEVAADLFDEKMLSLLRSAPPGRIQFEIGLQSFFEPALKASSRKMDIEKAEQNIRKLMQMENIHIHIDLIAGLPFETLNEYKNSFNRAYELNTHHLQLGFLKLLHGSELRKNAHKFGMQYSTRPPYEIIYNNWLTVIDLKIIKHVENALQNTRNKGRFLTTLDYILRATEMTPFELLHRIGLNVPSHATQLEDYIVKLFEFFTTLPGVDVNELKDCLIYDWLGMVKGKNTPGFLKNDDKLRKHIANAAEKQLGRSLRREEYAVLISGVGIFIDNTDRSPVTGLYRVYTIQQDR